MKKAAMWAIKAVVYACMLAAFVPTAQSQAPAAPKMGNFSVAGIYDVQIHSAAEVVAYRVKSYGMVKGFDLDLLAFGGTTSGPNAALTTGSALEFGRAFAFGSLNVTVGIGPAIVYEAGGKPHIGLFGGISGAF